MHIEAGLVREGETLEDLKAYKKRILEESFGQKEKAFLMKALKACNGNITRAAERVGMKRPNFSALMKKHQISVKSILIQEPNPRDTGPD